MFWSEYLRMPGNEQLKIQVISDTICPWCYVGKRRLERAIALLGNPPIEVEWKPFQLNPTMPREGMNRREYRTRKLGSWQHSQVLDAQVRAAGEEVGIAFAQDKIVRTPNTLASHQLIWLAGLHARQDAVVEAIFREYFCNGRDIGETAVLLELGLSAGLMRGEMERRLNSAETREAVLREERKVRGLTVRGVPTFIVNGVPLASGTQPEAVLASAFRAAVTVGSGSACGLEGDCT
jgi:predicted DsbA family dithiol-disulfide isomerase